MVIEDTPTSVTAGVIDVWIGSLSSRTVTPVICSVDLEKQDTEIKILLDCTSSETQSILTIHNIGSQSAILLIRGKSVIINT